MDAAAAGRARASASDCALALVAVPCRNALVLATLARYADRSCKDP